MLNGMSEVRLARIGEHLEKYVASGKLPGASILVTRLNEPVYYFDTGYADVERKTPIARDTVFRIYSMTKPITSVALMTLYERGMFQLDDPVSDYIPSWKQLRVYESGDGASMQTRELTEPMTIKQLLTHTSGLTYGFMQNHPVDTLYREKQVGGGRGRTLQDMVDALAETPLLFDPGSRWHYSVATDVCGYLVEYFSGEPLDSYIDKNVLQPAGMSHSGFKVKPSDRDLLAACYSYDPSGYKLQDDSTSSAYHHRPSYLSGGGGMVSTIDDYAAFANAMLAIDGEDCMLGLRTREYMMSNHLPHHADLAAMGQSVFAETSFAGVGFGLGFSVVVDPQNSAVLDVYGCAGWGGAASTYFWINPQDLITVVFMTQLLPSSTYPIRRELKTLVHQAIVEPADAGVRDMLTDMLLDEAMPDYDGEYDDEPIKH